MKANRKFVQADEAVSPVIAVILMVAITVVLAATVFVLVSDIGGNTATSAPTISWTADEGNDRLTVSTASQNADWNRLTVQVDSCTYGAGATAGDMINMGTSDSATPPATVGYQNDAALTTGADIATSSCGPAAKEVTGVAAKIGAGDFLEFCQGPAASSEPATNVKITIKDTTANAVVHTYTFTNIDPCTA